MLAGLFLWVLPCAAQVTVGENLQMNANATVSAGYAGFYGNQISSEHSLDVGLSGNLAGSFHSPSFVSFNILPYYNQSRDNSNYQSISDSSGINATANIFSGSHFPGSISFRRDYNSSGTFGVPEEPNFTTHGNSQGFSIGWSALLPGWPTLSASYSKSSGESLVYGTNTQSNSDNQNINLRSTYSIAGFHLSGTYDHSTSQATVPEFLAGQQEQVWTSSGSAFGVNASHSLPLHGGFSVGFTRSDYEGGSAGNSGTGSTIDSENAAVSFRPSQKLTLSFNESYSDNLVGVLNQAILSAGGVPPVPSASTSHSLGLYGSAGYALTRNLVANAQVSHIEQLYGGRSYGATFCSGNLNYGRKLFGLFTLSATVLDTATDAGNSSVGFMGNIGFSRTIKRWNLSGSFSYAQNVQTLLVLYTSSFYNYSGNVSRRLSKNVAWSAGFGGGHSGLTAQAGSGSSAESVSTSLTVHWLSASGNYSRSSGTSILTASGLQPTPVPFPVLPASQVILFGGSSYGFGIAASPVRRLSLSANYATAHNSTVQDTISSLNRTDVFNTTLQYQLRKIGLRAGYTKFTQGISASGYPPSAISSLYVGVSRWFNFF